MLMGFCRERGRKFFFLFFALSEFVWVSVTIALPPTRKSVWVSITDHPSHPRVCFDPADLTKAPVTSLVIIIIGYAISVPLTWPRPTLEATHAHA